MLRKSLLGLGMGIAMLLASTGTANAGIFDSNRFDHRRDFQRFKTITVFEVRRIPVTRFVTIHDKFGRPVVVKKVIFEEVRVPLTKRVPIF